MDLLVRLAHRVLLDQVKEELFLLYGVSQHVPQRKELNWYMLDSVVSKTLWSEIGGGVDYQCLSKQPQYLTVKCGIQKPRAYMTGVEYEDWEGGQLNTVSFLGVPCAVCYTSSRGAVLMIPGRYQCPSAGQQSTMDTW